MLKAWNIVLIMMAFLLSIFGTFVVRSGILASVHAFALSAIGPYFLTFLALVIGGSPARSLFRPPRPRPPHQRPPPLPPRTPRPLIHLVFLWAVSLRSFRTHQP